MAVELYPENNTNRGISPRISFSYDLNQSDIVPIEPHVPLKSSLTDYDFDFCVNRRSHDQESSMADELFANGIILPLQIKRKNIPIKSKSLSSSSSSLKTESSKETEEKQGRNNNNNNNKSFWKFNRSKSLNCGSIYSGGFCPLPLLSRSKSTGSTGSAKKSLISKDEVHNHHHSSGFKQSNQKNVSYSTHNQKPPLKKHYGSSSFNYGIVQVSPILNVPTGKTFGFGSIFSSGKDKNKKK